MKITETLIDDHRLIEKVLVCLEKAAEQLDNNQDIRAGFFSDVINFNKTYIESIHQKAEEAILFEAMVKHGLPKKDRPLSIAILEHEQAQLYMRRMKSAVERWQSGNKNARREVIRNALGFVSLLRQHMQDEDNKLYPKAKKIIPESALPGVMEAFDKHMQKNNVQNGRDNLINWIESIETEFD